MKSDYWDVTDEQVIEKTGKPLAHWRRVLDAFGAKAKKSNDVVAHLQKDHGVPRYWARTLTTWYLKQEKEV
ncbi:MAG TPA: DUF4287 domain-containing protein [Blastocatellia bacterium]|nr:DUF4287 domain-containing protein [Blastocatellia bacterium]